MKEGMDGWLSTAVMTGRTEVSDSALGRGLEEAPGYSRKVSRACAEAAGIEFNEPVGNWNWFVPGVVELKL